jgi:hypothetical protein
LCFAGIGKTDEALNGGPPFVHLVRSWREVQKHLNSHHGFCRRSWHGGEHGTGRRSTPGRARRKLVAYLLPRRFAVIVDNLERLAAGRPLRHQVHPPA